MTRLFVACLALLAAACAADGEGSPSDIVLTQSQIDAAADEGGLICEYRTVTGSNFKEKVCTTGDTAEEMRREGREMTEGIQRMMTPPGNQ